MPPEENKTQDTQQQDSAQTEPVVIETPAPVEEPTKTSVDTVPEITPAPAEQAQGEIPVVAPPIEPTVDNPVSPEERPLSAPLPEDSPPTPQPSVPAQAEPAQIPFQPQNKITPQGRTSPVAPPSSASPQGTTFSRDFVQKLLIKARAKIQERKRKKLDKIMSLFEAKPQITNKDIQKLLRISSATAVRYMNILERENRIKQVGNTGKSVFYTKI